MEQLGPTHTSEIPARRGFSEELEAFLNRAAADAFGADLGIEAAVRVGRSLLADGSGT